MEKKIDWHFKQVNPVDYELKITTEIENRLLKYVFQQARAKLARTKKINVTGNLDRIQTFEIVPQYYKLLQTILRKPVKEASHTVLGDGFEILNVIVKEGKFFRFEENLWLCEVIFTGQYADKR